MCSRISRGAIATCSRRSRRAPTRWKTPSRRMRLHKASAPAGRRLFSARVFLRGVGAVQSEHRRCIPTRPARPQGGCRFILSLRAVGEGHVSSLTFRSGSIAADGSVSVDPTARLASVPTVRNRMRAPDGDDVEVVFEPDEDISERVIFPDHRSRSRTASRMRASSRSTTDGRRPSTRPTPPIAAGRSAPS